MIQNTDKNLYITENREKVDDYQHLNDTMNHEAELQNFEPDKNLNSLPQYRDDKLGFRLQKEASPVNWVDKSMLYQDKRAKEDNNYRNMTNKDGIVIKQENGNNFPQNGPLPPFMN